jgi:hypothetical protein
MREIDDGRPIDIVRAKERGCKWKLGQWGVGAGFAWSGLLEEEMEF